MAARGERSCPPSGDGAPALRFLGTRANPGRSDPADAAVGRLSPLLLLALAAGCTGHVPPPVPRAEAPALLCATGHVRLHTDFSGARAGACVVRAEDRVALLISPERPPPINPSPWYAFRYRADRPVTVELRYLGAEHRYAPKISRDGRTWAAIAPDRVTIGSDALGPFAAVALPPGAGFVAVQELVGIDDHGAHLDALAQAAGGERRLIGRSHDGRPIEALLFGNERSDRLLVLIGRQHPPEVTGALAMRRFLDVLAGDGEGVRALRRTHRILAVPLLNPDGVARGHWRSNLGGVDLNRDWGPFTQPETRAVRDLVAALEAEGARPVMMIDFHSTWRNLFYLQGEDEPTDPAGLVEDWLARARPRLSGYDFTEERRNANPGSGTTKNHFYAAWRIPSVTYEVGDDTDRDALAAAAEVFAEALAETLTAGEAGR